MLLLAGMALAFPDVDPALEVPLVAEGVKINATSRGTWSQGKGLRLQSPVSYGDNYWTAEENPIQDGLVRARLRPGDRLEVSVLFRMAYNPANIEEFSGYGLTVMADRIFFHRWDEGLSLPMQEPTMAAGLKYHNALEVVVFLTGGQLAAFVFDADSLQQLASTTIHDSRYAAGQVGVYHHKRGGEPTVIEHLAVMPREPIQLFGDPEAPFGPKRLLTIKAEDVGKLPSAITPVESNEVQAMVVTDTLGAERIFHEGIKPIAVTGHVPWRYRDLEYASHRGKPPVATDSGFVIDASYKDPEMLEALLRGYNERFPQLTHLEELGRTHLGRPILALKISDNASAKEDEPALMINGAHHGSELLSVEYVLDAVQQLLEGYEEDPWARKMVDELEIWCVPQVNPDGGWLFTDVTSWAGRKNGRDTNKNGIVDPWDGVDLNRNYPYRWGTIGERGSRSWHLHYQYRGEGPASEPEVQAMMALASREHFAASISFHTMATLILSPYTIDGATNPAPDAAWQVAQKMAAAAPKQTNGKKYRVRRKIYSVDGTDQDWFFHAHGTLAYIVEGTHHNPEDPWTRKESVKNIRPVWKTLLDVVSEGPRISGHTVDSAGRPVSAQVTVEEVRTFEGEIWTSRPRDGRFDRVMAGPGKYVVGASLSGFKDTFVTVDLANEPKEIELLMVADGY
jgi:hypothetical protein